jgi:hypothetical protein
MTNTLQSLANWQNTNLQGGLPLIWQRRPGPAIVACRLWIRGGAARISPASAGQPNFWPG